MRVTCYECDAELTIGSWPFCDGSGHEPSKLATIPDDVPGGFVVENGFDHPTRFYSHSEHRAALKAEGCVIAAKWAGPNDKYLKRWDVPSQKTLDDAKVLLSRGKPELPSAPEPLPPITKRSIPGPWPEGVTHGG